MSVEDRWPRLRRVMLAMSALGALLFATGVALSFIKPIWIERAAREALRIEVERRVGAKVDQLTDSRVLQLAQKALGATDAQVEASRQRLRDELPQRVANAVADRMKADCECRQRIVDAAVEYEKDKLRSLAGIRERLSALIASSYQEVAQQLMREFRIFCGVNALAFALLGLITLKKRGALLQLLLPAAVLVGAAVLTGFFYLFGQNWLHTIVFGRYVGWAYVGWYALAVAWLVDVLCNRARVTTKVFNLLAQLAGSLLHAVPC